MLKLFIVTMYLNNPCLFKTITLFELQGTIIVILWNYFQKFWHIGKSEEMLLWQNSLSTIGINNFFSWQIWIYIMYLFYYLKLSMPTNFFLDNFAKVAATKSINLQIKFFSLFIQKWKTTETLERKTRVWVLFPMI